MNHVYRLVWSQRLRTWVAVSEITRGRKKGGGGKLAAATLCLATVVAQAAPSGGQVVSGSGQISSSGNTTTVTQSSQNLSLNWRSFNVAPQETVNFQQPSASAVAVNRIFDTNGSQILGHLNANGQVYLINPNGILFGKGSVVNVGGLVASTLNPTDANPSGATRSFSGSGTGSVTNEGTITAAPGGYVVLMGNHVTNTGTIAAQMGTVALGAGSAVTLTFDSDTLVGVQVDRSTLNNVAANGGLIQADGGKVIMTAGARDTLLASAVNNTGVVEARTVEDHDGTITLLAGMAAGQVNVGGTLDASAPNGGNGGAIETSAAHVKVANDARITTQAPNGLMGSWLVDPQDFTVAASGGDISGSDLSNQLATTNIELQSSSGAAAGTGNLNVNDAVSWSANTTLTLTASNNVNVNANITATGDSAGLVINPNTANGTEAASGTGIVNLKDGASITLSGAHPSLTIEHTPYTVINTLGDPGSITGTDLQGITGDPTGHYALGQDIDASATAGWNSGRGFTPIGVTPSSTVQFSGVFSGLGHTITNLFINLPTTDYVGLFNATSPAGIIVNVGMAGGSVTGQYNVGALVGANYGTVSGSRVIGATANSITGSKVGGLAGLNSGTISDSYATGSVNVTGIAGGLVGSNYGTLTNTHATGDVSGNQAGGLAGQSLAGTISNSYATGTVTGVSYGGGLVGKFAQGSITNSYATGAVSGSYGGGLVGYIAANATNATTAISNSYATGAVTAGSFGGGLVGKFVQGSITNSYATGAVSGPYGGGLVGYTAADVANVAAAISNSYATGAVTGTSYAGGLVGCHCSWNDGIASISNSYATGSVTGASNGTGGLVGLNYSGLGGNTSISNSYATGAVSTSSTFVGGLIGWDVPNATTTVTNSFWDKTTTGQATSSGDLGTGLTTAEMHQQSSFTNWDFSSTGSWAIYEGQTNPLLRSFLTPITVTANDATKTYDAQAYSGGNGVSYSIPGANLLGTLSYGGSSQGAINKGSYTITPQGLYSDQQGYLISYADGTLTVNPATLTVTGTTVTTKTYDRSTAATLTGGTLSGLQGSDALTLTQSGSFATANAGTGIAVTASDTISGTAASNYTLTQPTGLTGDITPATLTVTGTTAANKVYDGNTTAGLSGGTLSGVLGPDVVTLTQAGSFASKNVGTGIGVTATDALGGADAGNYTLTQPTGLTADITPATLTITGASAASNKVYDGTTAATITGGTLSGVIGSDAVTLVQGGTFASANVGTGIAVTASDSLTGAAAGNYLLGAQPTGLSANITPATLTVSGTSAANKVYDGTTAATLTGGTLSGVIGSDAVTLVQGGTFASANAGTGIAVTASDSLTGAAAGNYVLAAQPTGLSANITPAALTVTGTNVANKVYDGTTAATLSGGALSGVIGSDAVTLTQAGTFASANAGTGVAVTTADSLSGAAAGNYTLTQPIGLTANITPATLTVTGTSVANKVYDGTTAATLSGGTLSGLIGSDLVTLIQSGTFASPNAGTGVAVTTSDSLSGTAAGNYTLTQPIGLSANITPASLTITGTSVASKVYDGTKAATLTGGALSGVIGSDTVTLVQGGTFASANAGTGIAVTASDSLSGAAAGNYVLAAQPTGLVANITPATLTYIASPDKALSGKVPTGLDGTVTGFVAGETLASATTGTLSWTTSATESSPAGKYDIDGSGLSATNYTFVQAAGNATALTLTAAGSAPIPAVASIESDILQSPGSNAPPTIEQTFERNGRARLVIENLGVKLPANAISTH